MPFVLTVQGGQQGGAGLSDAIYSHYNNQQHTATRLLLLSSPSSALSQTLQAATKARDDSSSNDIKSQLVDTLTRSRSLIPL